MFVPVMRGVTLCTLKPTNNVTRMKNQVQVLPDLIAFPITFIDRRVDKKMCMEAKVGKPEKGEERQTEVAWEPLLRDFAFSTFNIFNKCLRTVSVFFFLIFFLFLPSLKKRIGLDWKQCLAFMLTVIRHLTLLNVEGLKSWIFES